MTTTNQQRAIFVNEIGKPVSAGTRDIPSPKAGQVLVKVDATQLMNHDEYGRAWGLFILEKLPFVLGSNVAGTIIEVGDNLRDPKVGERVFGLSDIAAPVPDQAGLQEYAVLDVDSIAKTPAGFSQDHVVTLPVNTVTAWIALFGKDGLGFPSPFSPEARTYDYKGQTLIINGAGASNGKFAIQFAKLAGIGRIIAISGTGSKDESLKLGATDFVDRHLPTAELAKQVHTLIGGAEGATHLYHCHGHDYTIPIALLPADKPSFLQSVHPVSEELTRARPLSTANIVGCSNAGLAPYERNFWSSVPGWLEGGVLRPGKFEVLEDGLGKVEEVQGVLDGYAAGKPAVVVVHP